MGRDLGHGREGALAQILGADGDVNRRIFVEAYNGRAAGVGWHGWRLPHDGNAFAPPLMGCGSRLLLAPVNGLHDFVNTGDQVNRRHFHAGENGLPGLDTVAPAEFCGVHADPFGKLIHDLLDAPMDFGHAKAAHRAADGLVGVDTVGITLDVGDEVRASAGIAGRSGDIDAIVVVSASTKIVLRFHGQQIALCVASNLRPGDQALAHRRADKLLFTCHAQLDGTPLDRSGHDHGTSFHRDARLAPKSTTHIRRHHAQVAMRDVQTLGDEISLGKGRLGTGPQGDLPRLLPQPDGDVGLDGHMLDLR